MFYALNASEARQNLQGFQVSHQPEEVSNFQFLSFLLFLQFRSPTPTTPNSFITHFDFFVYVYFLFFSIFLIYHLLPNLTLTQIFLFFSFKELKKNFNHTLQPKRELTKKLPLLVPPCGSRPAQPLAIAVELSTLHYYYKSSEILYFCAG